MLKKGILGIVLAVLLLSMLVEVNMPNVQPAKAWTGTVYIRADGSIDPLDAPITTYDNITYRLTDNITSIGDGIVIEKDNMVLDGAGYTIQGQNGGHHNGINLTGRNNITIKNINIQNYSYGIYLNNSYSNILSGNKITNGRFGIFLEYSHNNTFIRNKITENLLGIRLFSSLNNIISRNSITKNNAIGIGLYSSLNNTVFGNNITQNKDFGIFLMNSLNNTISGNNIENSTQVGIELNFSPNNVMSGNNITHNGFGIRFFYSLNNTISGNHFVGDGLVHDYGNVVLDNFVNGKPLVYLEEVSNVTVEDAGQVILINCTGIIIKNLTLTNTDIAVDLMRTKNTTISGSNITQNDWYGIFMVESSNNTVIGNNIAENDWYGIYLYNSSNNAVIGNSLTENNPCGIMLDYSSNNTVIENNFIHDGLIVERSFQNVVLDNVVNGKPLVYLENMQNFSVNDAGQVILLNCYDISIKNLNLSKTFIGIYLWNTTNSVISQNSLTDNWIGIALKDSSNNKIYHNNFINNTEHVQPYESTNVWDYGYPFGGNYWSDYVGVDVDEDGIGDTAYTLDANNTDRYPLMAPITVFDAGTWNGTLCKIAIVSNSTVSGFELNIIQKTLSFNVSGLDGDAGFCRITIPNLIVQNLWQNKYIILLNGTPWPFRNWTDTTNTYIYLNYTHSEHEITVIPELSTTIILPTILTLFTLATTLVKTQNAGKEEKCRRER